MKFVQFTRPARLLGAACLLAAGSGQALAGVSGPVLSDCTTLAGTNGLVTVTECAYSGGSGPISHGGTYGIQVSNASGAREVTSFYVSTNNPTYASPGEFTPFTSRSTWRTEYWSQMTWDQHMGTTHGKFGDLFGSDLGVYGYVSLSSWTPDLGGYFLQPLKIGETVSAASLTFGWYGGAPDSHFVAFNGTSVVSQSFTSPVPEPSAYALMLAGLGALGVMVRRRRTV